MGRALRKHQYGRNQRWAYYTRTRGLLTAKISLEINKIKYLHHENLFFAGSRFVFTKKKEGQNERIEYKKIMTSFVGCQGLHKKAKQKNGKDFTFSLSCGIIKSEKGRWRS